MDRTQSLSSQQSAVDISLEPNNIDAVPEMMQQIKEEVEALNTGDPRARQNLIIKARKMVLALETPTETMIKHVWSQGGVLGAISYGVDSHLWKVMAKSGDRPQKVSELAEGLGLNENVLSRLLRHLSAMSYIEEVEEDTYKSNNFIKSLSLDKIGDSYLAMNSCTTHGQLKFHEFSRKQGWGTEPTDARRTSLMYAFNMEKDMFSWQQEQGYGTHFNNHMSGYRQGRPPWCGPNFFPVQEKLIDGFSSDPNAPILVDIGGSLGHDLVQFHKFHPDHPGTLILQDLPTVIEQLKDLDGAIKPMPYSFLDEQPVKDDVCAKILKRIADAMEPGYSKILINENVIPTRKAYWETTALDIVMLAGFSSKERTDKDWHQLIEEKAGLKIVNIWEAKEAGHGVECLIEVGLA
ncbi:hypothetical protein N0V82_005119 [Gnomoniopsis sp. IMI 355080]|nr:hypothetical protein N0V82_005119 [Gnomoniopsis sp. IMI 355080]